MSLEVINRIKEAESKADRQKKDSAAEGKRILADLRLACEKYAEESLSAAETEAKKIIADAERQASEESQKIIKKADAENELIRGKVRDKIDKVSVFIVERIVDGVCQ